MADPSGIAIAETAAAGCDLVVFPETSATGNNGSEEVTRFAEPHDGPIFEAIHAAAKAGGIVVSYGFCERFRGTHYNTSALVGPDGLIGLQRKVHASYDEFFRFRQAYEWGVYDVGFCTETGDLFFENDLGVGHGFEPLGKRGREATCRAGFVKW